MFTWRKVGLAREVTLPSKKGSSRAHHLFFSVIKRQVSVRKCRKCWLAWGSWGRRVTLLPGATFFHIRGDLVVLGRPHGIGWRNNMNKQSLEPSSKTKELRSIGEFLLNCCYLCDHSFLLLKELISFFSFMFKFGNPTEV